MITEKYECREGYAVAKNYFAIYRTKATAGEADGELEFGLKINQQSLKQLHELLMAIDIVSSFKGDSLSSVLQLPVDIEYTSDDAAPESLSVKWVDVHYEDGNITLTANGYPRSLSIPRSTFFYPIKRAHDLLRGMSTPIPQLHEEYSVISTQYIYRRFETSANINGVFLRNDNNAMCICRAGIVFGTDPREHNKTRIYETSKVFIRDVVGMWSDYSLHADGAKIVTDIANSRKCRNSPLA